MKTSIYAFKIKPPPVSELDNTSQLWSLYSMKCWVWVTISHRVLVRSVLSPYIRTKPLQTEQGAHRERVCMSLAAAELS